MLQYLICVYLCLHAAIFGYMGSTEHSRRSPHVNTYQISSKHVCLCVSTGGGNAVSILQYFSFGVHPMIAGIANALLQVRIGMGKTVEPATSALTSIHFATRSTDAGPSAGEASSGEVGMKPITL
jgi:hypothetical protein